MILTPGDIVKLKSSRTALGDLGRVIETSGIDGYTRVQYMSGIGSDSNGVLQLTDGLVRVIAYDNVEGQEMYRTVAAGLSYLMSQELSRIVAESGLSDLHQTEER